MSEIDLDGDTAELVRRWLHLQARAAELETEIAECKAKIRSMLAVGDRGMLDGRPVVAVTPNRRFDAKAAQAALPPELVEMCTVAEFSAKAAKATLPPALYDQFMRETGEPIVRAI